MNSAGYHVKRRFKRKRNTTPPCEGHDEYAIDFGASWMSAKQYRAWKQSVITESWRSETTKQ
jgi:hypothetical protein